MKDKELEYSHEVLAEVNEDAKQRQERLTHGEADLQRLQSESA